MCTRGIQVGGLFPGDRLLWIRSQWRRAAVAAMAVAALTTCGMYWLAGVDGPRNGMSRPVQRGVTGRLIQSPADLVTNAFG